MPGSFGRPSYHRVSKGGARKITSGDFGIYVRPRRIKRKGIKRAGERRPHPLKPLSEVHLAIYAQLTAEPQPRAAIAAAAGVSVSAANNALFVLMARGLAERQLYVGWTIGERSIDDQEV